MSVGHKEVFANSSDHFLNLPLYTLGELPSENFPPATSGTCIFLHSQNGYTPKSFAWSWMSKVRHRTARQTLSSVPPLPSSAKEVIPEFVTLTSLRQNFPEGFFRVRSLGSEWFTSFIIVLSHETIQKNPYSLIRCWHYFCWMIPIPFL